MLTIGSISMWYPGGRRAASSGTAAVATAGSRPSGGDWDDDRIEQRARSVPRCARAMSVVRALRAPVSESGGLVFRRGSPQRARSGGRLSWVPETPGEADRKNSASSSTLRLVVSGGATAFSGELHDPFRRAWCRQGHPLSWSTVSLWAGKARCGGGDHAFVTETREAREVCQECFKMHSEGVREVG